MLVIGSGPAGVTVALELARSGRTVTMLTGGPARETEQARDLHRAEAADGPWGHEPLERNRYRGVGGASALWGGRCVLLDPIDFEPRGWVPGSGWPLTYEEYRSWLPRACDILKIGTTRFSAPVGDLVDGTADDASAELTTDSMERWSAPLRFAALLRREPVLRNSVRILEDAHAVEVLTEESGRVRGIRLRQGADEVVLTARLYVLATGGLENPRLLLHSRLAAALPALGHYYMAHTVASPLGVRLARPLSARSGFRREGAVWVRNRWRLADHVQRRERVGNAVAFLTNASDGLATADPLASVATVARLLREATRLGVRAGGSALRSQAPELRAHADVVRHGDAAFWRNVVRLGALRLGENRLPMALPAPTDLLQHVLVQGEHYPHWSSLVELGRSRDRLGVPRLRVRVDFGEGDFATVRQMHAALDAVFRESGATPLATPEALERQLRESMSGGFNSHSHHIGTTRMGTSATTSVVDADARVHGSPNLYVAGSSTFATSGHANPTLSIVMLAARLGAHLSDVLADSPRLSATTLG